jgi:hypothetical protein
VSGRSWPGLTGACDVHRSFFGDMSMALLAVGISERSCEGRRRSLSGPCLVTGTGRRGGGGTPPVEVGEKRVRGLAVLPARFSVDGGWANASLRLPNGCLATRPMSALYVK